MTSVDYRLRTYIDMHVVIFVVSSRRNKTNPHHGNKYIPVIDATHLQAFKPKRFTYDQLLKLINKMLAKMYVRKLKHFQPHSLLCQLWCLYIAICSFSCDIEYDQVESWRSSFDKLFFLITYNNFTLLIYCIETDIPAEQSLHHNIILEKGDHSWVNRVSAKNLISGSHVTTLSCC